MDNGNFFGEGKLSLTEVTTKTTEEKWHACVFRRIRPVKPT